MKCDIEGAARNYCEGARGVAPLSVRGLISHLVAEIGRSIKRSVQEAFDDFNVESLEARVRDALTEWIPAINFPLLPEVVEKRYVDPLVIDTATAAVISAAHELHELAWSLIDRPGATKA